MRRLRGAAALLACLFLLAACGGEPAPSSAPPDTTSAPVSAPAPVSYPDYDLSLAPFSLPETSASQPAAPRLLCSFPTLGTPRLTQLARGLQDQFDLLDVQLAMQDSQLNPATQAEALHNYIAQDVNAILCIPIDPDALEVSLEDAEANGVTVISAGEALPGALHFSLHTDYDCGYLLGQAAGQWLAAQPTGTTAALLDYPGQSGNPECLAGMEAGLLEAFPQAQVETHTLPGAEAAADTVAALLSAEAPPSVFIATDDTLALAAAQALAEAEADSDRDFVGGIGATDDALAALEADGPFRATVQMDWYAAGQALAEAVYGQMRGQAPDYQPPSPRLLTAGGAPAADSSA